MQLVCNYKKHLHLCLELQQISLKTNLIHPQMVVINQKNQRYLALSTVDNLLKYVSSNNVINATPKKN